MSNLGGVADGPEGRRQGFMYSIFAIFVLSIVVLVMASPVVINTTDTQSAASNIDESFYFLSSVEQDLERAGGITATRAYSAAVNHVAVNESALADGTAAHEVETGFRNGTINGTEQMLLHDSSFADWNTRMVDLADDAGWDLNITLTDVTAASGDPVTVYLDTRFNLSLDHPPSRTSFDRTVTQNYTASVQNITDPLMLLETDGQYAREFTACSSTERAEQFGTGSDYHYDDPENWTSGRAVVRPDNEGISGVADRSDRVVAVNDICAYDDDTITDEFSDFSGVISETSRPMDDDGSEVCGDADSSGINAYISGIDGITNDLSNGTMTVMTDSGAWANHITDEVEEECYFSSDSGPHIFDRLEGRLYLSGDYTGWSSFVNIPRLPPTYQDASRSAVDHVYFDEDSTENHRIKGVSDHHDWFQLDQEHIDSWDLNDLAYD